MNHKSVILTVITAFLIVTAVTILHHNFPALFGSRTSITKLTDTSDGNLQSYYNQAQNLAPRGGIATTSATFLAVGDIMLSRNVAAAIKKSGDVDYPFLGMADILKSTDFNFANLESPVPPPSPSSSAEALAKVDGGGIKGEGGIIGGHSMIFAASADYIKGMADYNFKILNLANNHSFDQGLAGIDATRSALDNLGIVHEGTGDNLDEAWTPATVTANGIKICFIGASYASINDSGKTINNYVARIGDIENLKLKIENSKLLCDFTVVTMHAGTEYTRTPNQAQIKFAHAAIDDGADMVIGAHPHWVQTMERYCPPSNHPPLTPPVKGGETADSLPLAGKAREGVNCKYIFYSLGNFIFDQNFSQDTMEGLTLKITLSKTGATPVSPSFSRRSDEAPAKAEGSSLSADDLQGPRIPAKLESIELIPVIIQNSQPRPATAEEGKKILKKINLSTFVFRP